MENDLQYEFIFNCFNEELISAQFERHLMHKILKNGFENGFEEGHREGWINCVKYHGIDQ